MPDKVQFSRELERKAKEKGTALFCVAFRDEQYSASMHTPALPSTMAESLWRFCVLITEGATPEESFDKVFK